MLLKDVLVGGSCLLLGYGLGAALGAHPRGTPPLLVASEGATSPVARERVAAHQDLRGERDSGGASSRKPEEGTGSGQGLEAVQVPAAFRSPYYDWLSEEELEAQFGDLSEPELVGLEKGLEWVLHSDAQALLDEQFERGVYLTQILSSGEMQEIPTRAADGGLVASKTMNIPREDGTIERRVALVRLSDHPILAARDSQLLWVRTKLKALDEGLEADSER